MEIAVALEVIIAALRARAELQGLSIESVTGSNVPNGISVRHVGPGIDANVQPLETIFSTLTFYVVLALPGESMTLQTVGYLRAIHRTLQGLQGFAPIAGGAVYACVRTGPIGYEATGPDGRTWQYNGGIYEVDARAD